MKLVTYYRLNAPWIHTFLTVHYFCDKTTHYNKSLPNTTEEFLLQFIHNEIQEDDNQCIQPHYPNKFIGPLPPDVCGIRCYFCEQIILITDTTKLFSYKGEVSCSECYEGVRRINNL